MLKTKLNKLLDKKDELDNIGIDIDIDNLKLLEKKLKKNEYIIAVMGAMKSGKSTFIDAILGYDFMPNENAACTLTATDIINECTDNKIKKIYKNGEFEYIEGQNLHRLFHDDIRKSRTDKIKDDFHYEVKYNIQSLKNCTSKAKFIMVDTPGYNEMEGLGVKKEKIINIFEETLKRASYVVYVLDYQYYKSDENLQILNKIREIRPDIFEKRIVFVLNKLDEIGYKDKQVDDVVNSVRIALESWGIKDKIIYPVVARQALFGRMIENNHDLSEIEAELDNYVPIVEQEIDGKIYHVKQDIKEIYKDLIISSGINKFEENLLIPLFNNAYEDINNSAFDIIEKNVDYIIAQLNNKKIDLLKKQADEQLKLNTFIRKLDIINECINEKIKVQNDFKKLLNIPSRDSVRQNDFYKFSICSANYPYDDGSYKYKSEYEAESAGKNAFRRWKNGMRISFEHMYEVYNNKLRYESSKDNYFYNINNTVSQKLKELNNFLDRKLKEVGSRELISIISLINIIPDTLKQMTYENTKEYIDDIYDNSTFVDTDCCDEYVGEGFFGAKYKTTYCYKTSHARSEEEKDLNNGLTASSETFFSDYYEKKYKKYLKSVQQTAFNELEKIEPILKKIKNDLEIQMNSEMKNKQVKIDNVITELNTIEQQLVSIKEK